MGHTWEKFPNCIYFAVETCRRGTFLSTTLTFLIEKSLIANCRKHQKHCSAWVGQADLKEESRWTKEITVVTVNACK